jgi:SNF2 family DNA or RNA helicase
MAVAWGYEEARILKNLGVKDVPSPIKREYNWPGLYKPMEHQIETAGFLTMHHRAFCFDEVGLGKTLSCLWAADYLMAKRVVRRVLILCPLSIMNSAWLADLSKSILHRSAAVAYASTASKRKDIVHGGYEFVISNFDGLEIIDDEIIKDGRFDLVITDESNVYKSIKTRRWKTLSKILRPTTRLWMLTGTPAPQSPVDAFGLAKLVNPNAVPQFTGAWRDKVLVKVAQFKWKPRPEAPQLVFNALQPAIRHTKEQCLDLPPVITLTREIPLTPQQDKYYKQMKREQLVKAAGETVSSANAAIVINKLLQISSGAVYSDEGATIDFDCAPRLNALLEVLEETDRKVIVFVPFKHAIAKISEFLQANGQATAIINGDVSLSDRTNIFKTFQQPGAEPRIVLIQPQAAAHGVTLTAADTVVFWGPVTSVELYLQAIGRADRIGQTGEKVTVIHFQSSEVERKLYKQLQGNLAQNDLMLTLYEEEFNS